MLTGRSRGNFASSDSNITFQMRITIVSDSKQSCQSTGSMGSMGGV